MDYRIDVRAEHCLYNLAHPRQSKKTGKQRHMDNDCHWRKRPSHHSDKVRTLFLILVFVSIFISIKSFTWEVKEQVKLTLDNAKTVSMCNV